MTLLIASVQNRRIKAAVKLRDHRQRIKQGRFLIDGVRELARALQGGVQVVETFVCPPLCQSEQSRQVVEQSRAAGSTLWTVTPTVFAKLAFGDRAEGVVAVARTPSVGLADLRLPDNPLVAVLEGIEKPGNVGAVLRSADGAGLSAVIVADGCTDLYNPNVVRASLGTLFTLPVAAAGSQQTRDWLRQQGLKIFAARVDGAAHYTDVSFQGPSAIVLGSEARGLSDVWRDEPVTAIALTMLGAADSLNVSATAAVLFYEARRQRSLQTFAPAPHCQAGTPRANLDRGGQSHF